MNNFLWFYFVHPLFWILEIDRQVFFLLVLNIDISYHNRQSIILINKMWMVNISLLPCFCPKLMDVHVQILGAPIQLMGCFEIYPSTCWVSSENMNVKVTNIIMTLYHFIFLGCHKVSYHYEMFKTIHMTNF
jgi:hypothetical protein